MNDACVATLKPNSRPYFVFDAEVDWFERHEFLKCMLSLILSP